MVGAAVQYKWHLADVASRFQDLERNKVDDQAGAASEQMPANN
jgi:hypothetical protein